MSDIALSSTCKAGQKCRVILVGHCFRGIIVKDFLVKCHGFSTSRDPDAEDVKKMKMFLQNCKAIFYYSTPNAGTMLMDRLAYQDYILNNVNQPVVDFLKILSKHTAKINSEFITWNKSILKLATQAIGETLDTKLRKSTRRIRVVSEASARQDVDSISWAPDADHFDVSKAKDNSTCCIFTGLRDLVADHYINASPSTPTGFRSALNFSNDEFYVPLENTISEVDDAFRESQVVVLYGDSGMGKSCLARHYALCFEQKHVQEASSNASGLSQSTLGPAVVFVTCGEDAKITSKQQFLLIKFDVEYSRKGWEELDEAEIQRLLRDKLKEHIEDRQALVVLDDVWEKDLVANVLVRGSNLRYLITSRNRDLWRHNAEVIEIGRVNMEHGRRILANYAKWGDHELFEGQADELIKEVGFHPLALATLGMVLQTKKRQYTHEWQDVKCDFLEYLKSDDDSYHPTLFDEGYPRSLHAAMMLMVNELDEASRTVLFTINIFKGKRIPKPLVELFLLSTHPYIFKSFCVSIEKLERLSLVRREAETTATCSSELPFSEDGNENEGEVIVSGVQEITYDVLVIHDLRRKFLSENKSSRNRIISFLFVDRESFRCDPDRRSKYDLATFLCSVHGQSSLRETARTWLPIPEFFPQQILFDELGNYFLAKLVCSVREQASSSTAAIEVFLALFLHSKIDLHNVPSLVERESNRHAIELVCLLLRWAAAYYFDSILIDTGDSLESLERSTLTDDSPELVFINIGGSLERFTQVLSPNGGIKSLAVLSILRSLMTCARSRPSRVSIRDFMSRMVATNLVDMVFMILDTKDRRHESRWHCILSLRILRAFLAKSSQALSARELLIIATKITCPKNLDIIARLVIKLPNMSSYDGNETAKFLRRIAKWHIWAPSDAKKVLIKNLMENALQTSNFCEAALRKYIYESRDDDYDDYDDSGDSGDSDDSDDFDDYEDSDDFDSEYDGNDDVHDNDDDSFVRFAAMHLPSLLSSAIMQLLLEMKSHDKFALSVKRLAHLPRVIMTIVNNDLLGVCLNKLVELLDKSLKTESQIHALRALYVLAKGDTYACNLVNDVQVKMLETEHLFERVIMLLSELPHIERRCRWAAALFVRLITIQGPDDIVEPILQGPLFVSLSGKAGHFSTCLERIAMLLRDDVEWDIQKSGLKVLLAMARLTFNFVRSGNSNLIDVSAISDLLGRVVTLLVPELESIQNNAVEALVIVARFRFDERLGVEVYMRRLATPDLLEKLATTLSRKKVSTSPRMCELAVRIIQSLATQPAVGEVIARFRDGDALIIENLLGLLELNQTVAHAPKSIQVAAVEALIRLPVRAEIETRIQNMHIAPDILSGLYSRWGWTNVMRKDYEAALEDLNRALEWEPGDVDSISFLLQERGIVQRYLDDLDGALEDLDEALEVYDDNYECLKHRGLVKYKLGDEEGARKDAERAVTVRTNGVDRGLYNSARDVYDLCLGVQSVKFLEYRLN